ncbi:MAG: amidohydrolase family protein [Thermoplasmata archaeon]|nr:amidohydrolase family protein [Thermoplasmata archaeon]
MAAGPGGDAPGRGGSADRDRFALVLAGRILRGGTLEPAEIGIDEVGRIRHVARSLRGERRIDVGERVILPAATDLHVHFREPGGPDASEDLQSGTLQAAYGGVGAVGEMPNTEPPTDSVEAVEEKAARTRGRIAVDVLLYAGIRRPEAIARLARVAGAYKLYLSPTTRVDGPMATDRLPEILGEVAATGLALTVHAEDPLRFQALEQLRTTAQWDAHRPKAAERSGVESLLPAPPALRLHIAHVTHEAVAERLREAGHSFEATPQHLLLSTRTVSGAFGKVNPPLRSEAERASLWTAFSEGRVPILASDHAPHPLGEKEREFGLAPSGMPGVETMLPLLLARSRAGHVPLATLVAAACDRPARWLGLPTGRIAPGHRANLIVVDFRSRSRVSADHLHAPCHWTAFEGWEAVFPQEHFRDGERIVHDGEFVGRRDGKVVRPEYAPSARRTERPR